MRSNSLVVAGAAALALLVAANRAQGGQDESLRRGLYVLGNFRTDTDEKAVANPSIVGFASRIHWKTLEPSEGQYDWTALDKALALVRKTGKALSIHINPGISAPEWVYAKGARSYPVDARGGETKSKAPVPTDPIYLEAWLGMIRAAGEHVAKEPLLSAVKITGMNASTGEYGRLDMGGNAEEGRDLLVSLGCDRSSLQEAHKKIVDAFLESFPSKRLALMMGQNAFLPFDDKTDRPLREILLESTCQQVGPERFIAQNNGLVGGAKWSRYGEARAKASERKWQDFSALLANLKRTTGCDIAYQMGWSAVNDPNKRMGQSDPATNLRDALDKAWNDRPAWYEIYEEDVLSSDAAVQQVLADYAALYASGDKNQN
ncbi:MAG: beta-galactosidase [Candidatus Sumerlaeota bacterium]|nr:beta-galactosidase [Candidatus Sumerlaeota bacterium]